MRTLAFSLFLLLAGCATMDGTKQLTGADVVALAQEGKTAPQIIAELQRTNTVLILQASDFVRLHDAGVPDEVLNYMQSAQIDELRWRDRMYWGPYYRSYGFGYGYGPCYWPRAGTRAYRGGAWGC
jgi:hypothetical protein